MTEPVIEGFNRHLRAYIARRVDAAFVDDIFGEIMLRAATHRDQFDAADNPLAWLYKVAGNVITDHYRRRSVENAALRQLAHEVGDISETGNTDEAGSIGEADSYRELAPCLLPMIEALPAEYRDALRLTDLQGMTQADAAAQAGLSVSGMKSRVQRGREKLKDALHRCCEIELNRQGRIVDYTQRDSESPCGKSCG